MADNINGNFAFMYHIDRDLYAKLNSAERQARTNFRNCGHESREALELFIRIVLDRHGLTKACIGKELRVRIDCLRSEKFLREEGYLNDGESLDSRKILPDLGRVTFYYESGKEKTADYLDFIRMYGNTCSHADRRPSDVKLSYENTLKCLKGLFLLLRKYYRRQIQDTAGHFDENLMPVGEYCVYASYVPQDSLRSRCIREFLAYTPDENGDKRFYAILRLYNKSDLSDVFMLRNQKCFTEASKMSFSAVPDGMTKMREVIPSDSQASSFYMLSYIFNQEPHPLNNALLSGLDLRQKVRLCGRIANCLDNLHTLPVPIYHRMLNYDCVFVCEIRGEWIPYIVKFDYAKLYSGGGTVQVDASRAKEFIKKEETLNKYLAPEWDSPAPEQDGLKWEKADVYSLGVLCSDILYGKIDTAVPSLDDLEEMNLSDEILDMLDRLRADDPDERPDIVDVKNVFDGEQRKLRIETDDR